MKNIAEADHNLGVNPRARVPGSKTRLPSLNALRAFHVVFQHLSLRRAGEELSVTPQAVGQQIKLLEDSLNVTLFERRGRTIQPTEAAILLSVFVKSAFDELSEGVRRVTRSSRRSCIALNVSPYFATHYLVPMLSTLHDATPGTEIRLTTTVYMPDFDRDGIDMAIQWGYGDWKASESTLLVPDPKVICCTPSLAKRIRTPADLKRMSLLNATTSKRLWPDIFRHLGIRDAPPEHKIAFDDAATMRRATLQGIGIGLLSEAHADEDLRSGALVAPLGRHSLSGMPASDVPGFYLVAPRANLRVPATAAFYRWLLDRNWKATVIAASSGAEKI